MTRKPAAPELADDDFTPLLQATASRDQYAVCGKKK